MCVAQSGSLKGTLGFFTPPNLLFAFSLTFVMFDAHVQCDVSAAAICRDLHYTARQRNLMAVWNVKLCERPTVTRAGLYFGLRQVIPLQPTTKIARGLKVTYSYFCPPWGAHFGV